MAVNADAQASAGPTIGLSSGLMIVLTHDCVKMAPDASGFGALGLAELRLLEDLVVGADPTPEHLAQIADSCGADVGTLEVLVSALRAQGMIVDHPSSTSVHREPPVAVSSSETASPPGPEDKIVIPTPLVLRLSLTGFEHLDHVGRSQLSLTAVELVAASEFRRPVTAAQALEGHRRAAGPMALDDATFASLLEQVEASGLTHRLGRNGAGERDTTNRTEREWRTAIENLKLIGDAVERRTAEYEAQQDSPAPPVDLARIDIMGVHPHGPCPPLAIAMVLAHARAHDGGRLQERFDFFPRWVMAKSRLPSFTAKPGIFLFSNYLWSVENNLELTAEVKRLSPGSITIHGGPDTPKYDEDVERFFASHPQVDIAVRGEGEATMAGILEALMEVELGDGPPDLSSLRDVPGLCFRDGAEIVRTEDRERIADVDSIPSPYLTGLLEPYGEALESTAIIETNRGCPYGCTFCDWGSATLSRIRKFDLERVFAELEWCAQRGVARVWLADANFGIFERDVAIAEKVAELKSTYGYPKVFATNYAKNTVKHLKSIVKVMADAGILTEGLLSLQSMDEGTLDTIKRSNIKLEKYEDLAREFRAAKLPLFVDLMVGLPGATLASFRNDLQECLEREVSARIFSTTLLVNSPMNEPSYRETHKIETELVPGSMKQRLVVSTATFTRTDHDDMLKLREIYIMCENHGMLRQVSRFVRQEVGMREVDLYETLWKASLADRNRWPAMAFVFETGPSMMVPPVSWRLFIDELRTYLVEVLGLPGDGALESVLEVQHALLPTRNRPFPDVLELSHDFGAWHAAMIEAKDQGRLSDWPSIVPRLRDMPPGQFPVDDPMQVCTLNMGYTWRVTSTATGSCGLL
ncbi:MAG: radical SAM protein [Acidimicrobiales bacterium]